MKPKLILLCGLPGSGKTTYRNGLVADNPNLFVLSTDDFIHDMAERLNQTYEQVFKDSINLSTRLMMYDYHDLTKHGFWVVLDRTNLTPKARAKFDPPGYERHAVNFHTQYGSVHQIPGHVLDDMRKNWVPATTEEGFHSVTDIGLPANIPDAA